MSNDDETSGREERIEEIIAACLDAREAGDDSSLEAIVARYPGFEKELREFLENEGFVMSVLKADDDVPPYFGGDYEVLEEIGRGGMGVVYKCRQKSLDKPVAIKTIIGGSFVTPPDIERIRKEAQKAAGLRHPNIVTVHHVAEYDGQHFFVMDYIEGRSLADLVHEPPLASSNNAVQYLKTIADAIHYAHQRQILHCDLKPANILIDDEGKLYVTDFGLAKRLGEDGKYLPLSTAGGTATYMAPEQVTGDEFTTATDIYGLGGILYALLTGSSPFRGKTLEETLKRVREESPTPPRARNPEVDKDLEAICLMCLKKNKDERYGSAYGLVRDLERYQNGEETAARRWTRRERVVGWCRRNPVIAGMISAVTLMSILTLVMAVSTAKARESAQLQDALQTNTFAARDLATTALFQLTELSRNAERITADPGLAILLAKNDRNGLQRFLFNACGREFEGTGQPIQFKSCYILNRDGIMTAHAPGAPDLIGKDFSFRDYFKCAQAQGRPACISRVYHGTSDALYKFAISAPIRDRQNNFLGMIATSVTTDAAMGPVITTYPNRKVAIIALTEPSDLDSTEGGTESSPDKYAILFHPGYRRGVDPVEFPYINKIRTRPILPDDNYTDPVSSVAKDYEGRWIAGFAPAGDTHFVVIVQQRYAQALALDPSTFHNLIVWTAIVIFLAIAIIVFVLWRWPRRSHAPALG